MENGRIANDHGLFTVPRDAYNGLITGQYPPFKIRNGDHFQGLVNCGYKAYSCNVVFMLEYQVGGGAVRSLGRWNEAYEGKFYTVDIDLSSLAGQNVKFILGASTNGPSAEDEALWIAPRITRRGAAPPTYTPTLTPSPTVTATSTFTVTSTPLPSPTSSESPTP
jgi:hypothetical protein